MRAYQLYILLLVSYASWVASEAGGAIIRDMWSEGLRCSASESDLDDFHLRVVPDSFDAVCNWADLVSEDGDVMSVSVDLQC